MPWGPQDATRHDKKARSAVAKRQWSDVANSVLKATGDEGRAVREANGAVAKRVRKTQKDTGFHGSAANYKHSRPTKKVIKRTY